MDDQQFDRNPIEVLADEFAARFRRGERPSVAEYTSQYPDHATEIEELFPSIVMMEQLKEKQESDVQAAERQRRFAGRRIERLGDYEIVQEIGRGGMGVVFEATQSSLGRRVALKVLSDSAMASDKQVQRFEREARAAAALHHTNIVPVFGVGHEDDLYFYVMQYIDGVGLDEILTALRIMVAEQEERSEAGSAALLAEALRCGSFAGPRKLGSSSSISFARETLDGAPRDETLTKEVRPSPVTQPVSGSPSAAAAGKSSGESTTTTTGSDPSETFGSQYFKSIARIGLQVADALQYAHGQNVLHRDIKPGNLLLDAQGTVWVTDFGLAKLTEQKNLTKTGDIVGTLRYMAPEQLDGVSDQRSDLYSLGLTLYEMLTLRQACDDNAVKQMLDHRSNDRMVRPRVINRHIPPDLETIVLKAVSAEPAHRYATAADLGEDLQRFLDDRPIRARRVTPVERVWRWSRRNPAMAALSGTALSLAILVLVLLSLGFYRAEMALGIAGRERQAAEDASKLAKQNLNLAFQAFDSMMDNIGSRGAPPLFAMEPDGSLDGGDEEMVYYGAGPTAADVALLSNMLDMFEGFAGQASQEFGDRSARAYRRIGDIQQRLNRREDAVQAYQRSLQLYEQLAVSQPQDVVVWVVAQAEVISKIASATGRSFFPSREEMGKALRLLEDQPPSVRSDPRIRFALAQMHLQMVPRVSVEMRDFWELIPNRPGRPGRRPSGSRSWLIETAETPLHEAERLLEELHTEFPENRAYRFALARCFQREIRFATFDPQFTAVSYEKPVTMLQRLFDEDPTDHRYGYELADTLQLVFTLNAHQADRLSQIKEAIEIARSLVVKFPGEPEYEDLLANCLTRDGKELMRTYRIDGAAASLSEAKELRTTLATRYPSLRIYQMFLAVVRNEYAEVLFSQRRFEEALLEKEAAELLAKEIALPLRRRNQGSGSRRRRGRSGVE